MIKTAIVILNWNGKHFLEKFLPTLVNYTNDSDSEIIIADNNSKDNSIEYLKENYPTIRTIIFDKNYGFTGGYNKALNQIEAKYYVLLNSDIEVTNNWLSPLIECLDSDDKIAACQPKIKSYAQKELFEYAGAAGGFIDKYGYPFCRGRILGTIEKDENQYDATTEIFWASGACMVVNSELYHKAGGLDDDFFAHMEEIDLCWRLQNMGYKIVYNPLSEVYHVGGGTLPNNNPFKLYLNFRNNLYLLYNNLPKGKVLPIMFARMCLDGLSALTFLIQFKFSSFNAVFKAHMHFYKNLKKNRSKRKELLKQAVSIPNTIYKKSIVLSYFIKSKKIFSDLKF